MTGKGLLPPTEFLWAPSMGPYSLDRNLKYGLLLYVVREAVQYQLHMRIPNWGRILGEHRIYYSTT